MSRSWTGGSTRRWRMLRAAVLDRDHHRCQVPTGAGVCGAHATHVDHIVALVDGGPRWDPANLRAACASCNLTRGTRARAAGPTVPVTVVIGPPGAGKTTFITRHAVGPDVVIDLDRIAVALTPTGTGQHDYPAHVRHVAIGARAAAIRRAVALARTTGARVWIVHAVPTVAQLRAYLADGWTVQVCDPGPQVVRQRTSASDRAVRHHAAIDTWYTRWPQLDAVLTAQHVEPWEW